MQTLVFSKDVSSTGAIRKLKTSNSHCADEEFDFQLLFPRNRPLRSLLRENAGLDYGEHRMLSTLRRHVCYQRLQQL